MSQYILHGINDVEVEVEIDMADYDFQVKYEDAFEKAVKVKEPVLPDDSTFPIYEKRYKEWCRLNEIMKTYWDEKSKG